MTMKIQLKTHLPILTLNMDEKIYLAVTKNTNGKMAFVYTLACSQRSANFVDYTPTREIHVFKDAESADIYHAAIEQIIDANLADKDKADLFKQNDDLIMRFMENTR